MAGWLAQHETNAQPKPDDGIDLFIWGNAESCVTIIAASIPILRVFVRDVQTSARKYYLNTDGESQTNQGSKKSKRNITAVASTQHSRSTGRKGDDDSSDKSILDGFSSHGKHIMQTNEIAVEYEMKHVLLK